VVSQLSALSLAKYAWATKPRVDTFISCEELAEAIERMSITIPKYVAAMRDFKDTFSIELLTPNLELIVCMAGPEEAPLG
jgi:hypothetical protein